MSSRAVPMRKSALYYGPLLIMNQCGWIGSSRYVQLGHKSVTDAIHCIGIATDAPLYIS
jgi:hypothetical protein